MACRVRADIRRLVAHPTAVRRTTVAPRVRACSATPPRRVDFRSGNPMDEDHLGTAVQQLSKYIQLSDRAINASLARWATVPHSALILLLLSRASTSSVVSGVSRRPPVAALHFLNYDPSDLSHVLPFDTDMVSVSFFTILLLLRSENTPSMT